VQRNFAPGFRRRPETGRNRDALLEPAEVDFHPLSQAICLSATALHGCSQDCLAGVSLSAFSLTSLPRGMKRTETRPEAEPSEDYLVAGFTGLTLALTLYSVNGSGKNPTLPRLACRPWGVPTLIAENLWYL
jgi:hypothetical protein